MLINWKLLIRLYQWSFLSIRAGEHDHILIALNDFQFPDKIWLLQKVIVWYLQILKIVFVRTQIVIFTNQVFLGEIQSFSFGGSLHWEYVLANKNVAQWRHQCDHEPLFRNGEVHLMTYVGPIKLLFSELRMNFEHCLGHCKKINTKKGGNCLLTKASWNLRRHLRLFQRKKKYITIFLLHFPQRKGL